LATNFFKAFRKKSGDGNVKPNKKLITFLVCIILSLFFWFIVTFSRDYTSTITFPVSYLNFPKNKVIVNHLPSSIDVDINASGFTIIYYKLRNEMQPVKIDLKDVRAFKDQSGYFIAVNSRLDRIGRQFGSRLKMIKVSPDTLFINYSRRINKTVPVKLNAEITFNKEYQLKDSIKLIPAKVMLSGPEEQVQKIKYAETEFVKLEDVDNTVKKELKLTLVNDTSTIEVSNAVVQLIVPVTKFTEASLEIPVQADNLPKGYTLKTFPDKVTLKFTAPFEEFEKMDASSFRVRVDYSKKTNSKKLKVEVVKKPSNVKSFKIIPEKVEFIVHK